MRAAEDRRSVAHAEPGRWALPETDASSGCFETIRVYEGKIFRLAGHLDRLRGSMRYLGVRMSMTLDKLGARLQATVDRAGVPESIVRVALIPGAGKHRIATPSIVVMPVPLPPRVCYERGIRVAIVPTRRFPVGQIDPQAKFSARLGSILAVIDAQLRGVDEAIFQDGSSSVTESTASNIGIIKQGAFIAPPCWLGLLAGITWEAIVEAARGLKIPVREAPLTRHELYNADEAFLTSTIKEILPVTAIDGRTIGAGRPGPTVARLHQAFKRLVKRELRLSRVPDVGLPARPRRRAAARVA